MAQDELLILVTRRRSGGAECWPVDERGPEWWLDEHRQWRQGTPPAGWHQGADGRWRPAWNDPTEELRTAALPRHAAPRPSGDKGRFDVPQWARIGAGALAATVVLGVGLALALGSRGDDPEGASGAPPTTTGPDLTSTTSTTRPDGSTGAGDDANTSSSSPSTSTTTTTKPPKHGPPSTEPGPDGPDPLALCSPGQQALIERGNHPPSWYIDRFDADHDGIYCE